LASSARDPASEAPVGPSTPERILTFGDEILTFGPVPGRGPIASLPCIMSRTREASMRSTFAGLLVAAAIAAAAPATTAEAASGVSIGAERAASIADSFNDPDGGWLPADIGTATNERYTAAATSTLSDPAWDVPSAAGDVLAFSTSYHDGVVSLAFVTRATPDPFTAWIHELDGPMMLFDVDGDGDDDYALIVFPNPNQAGSLLGGVMDSRTGIVTCWPGEIPFLYDNGYAFSFSGACIGRPSGYWWGFAQFYNGAIDAVPDLGWGPYTAATVTAPPPSPPDPTPTPAPTPTPTPSGTGGYWMLGRDGVVYGFGTARHAGNANFAGAAAVDLEPTRSGHGYWVVAANGAVNTFGDAAFFGAVDAGLLATGEHVSTLTATMSGRGYWIFTDRGRVFIFGDAVHYGDMAGISLNGPIVGSTMTTSGRGYWLVGADGGIFTFGDAQFFGSVGNLRLNQPVVGLAPDSDGRGYWLVAADGGIFAFDASFRGSMGATRLNRPVIGAVAFGDGYLMVGSDGGIFTFSTREFCGSLGANPPAIPIVSVAVRQ
jgi:hypothetical protein